MQQDSRYSDVYTSYKNLSIFKCFYIFMQLSIILITMNVSCISLLQPIYLLQHLYIPLHIVHFLSYPQQQITFKIYIKMIPSYKNFKRKPKEFQTYTDLSIDINQRVEALYQRVVNPVEKSKRNQFTFCKEQRWKSTNIIPKYHEIDIKSTLSKKANNFGVHLKKIQYNPIEKPQTPSPNHYVLQTKINKGGKTILKGWQKQRRRFVHKSYIDPVLNNNPGVGSYDIQTPCLRDNRRIYFSAESNILNNLPFNIGPDEYKPNLQAVSARKIRNISFGKSQRIDLSKPLNQNPGIGSYELQNKYYKRKKGPKEISLLAKLALPY